MILFCKSFQVSAFLTFCISFIVIFDIEFTDLFKEIFWSKNENNLDLFDHSLSQ